MAIKLKSRLQPPLPSDGQFTRIVAVPAKMLLQLAVLVRSLFPVEAVTVGALANAGEKVMM